MSNSYILKLHEVNKNNIDVVGGKGANLGEMISNHFPVPDGFCIHVNAYKRFISANDLQEKINQRLQEINWDDLTNVEEKAALIRNAIIEQELQPELKDEILKAYQTLEKRRNNKLYVAVRSSATAEDLPDASFAGQQETFLYVSGENELLQYVKSCWASLWSARAMSYRQKNSYDHNKVFISVVIQEMVNSKVSGILFTNNPLSQNKNEMLVTSSYGLGELIVSGQVTPDSFIINKENLNVIGKELGSKENELVMGTTERTNLLNVPENKRNEYSLSKEQLQELGALAMKVENHYGFPQDIEWGLADEKFYLLQSRPITTLNKTEQAPFKNLSKTDIKILDDLLEHYPEAPTPLDYTLVTISYQALLDRGEELGIRFSKATEVMKMDDEGLILLYPPKMKVKWKIINLLPKLIKANKDQDQRWNVLSDEMNGFMEKMKGLKFEELSDQKLIQELEIIFRLAKKVNQLRFFYIVDSTLLPLVVLSTILKSFTSKKDRPAISDVITTNLNFKTSIIDKKLSELALQIIQYPEVNSFILEGDYKDITDFQTKISAIPSGNQIWKSIQVFLNQYGYRTDKMYQPFTSKSWLDDQMHFLDILKAALNDPQLYLRKRKEEERNEKHQIWLSQFENKLKGPVRRLFKWSLEILRKIYIYREETVFFIEVLFHYGRMITNELGSKLKKEGKLEDAKDIVYFRRDELRTISSGQLDNEIIEKRKANLRKNQLLWKQSKIKLTSKIDENSELIKGFSGSNGLAEGPVRIIMNVEDFKKLKQGDILVCPYTDPSWTPLFGIAAAVVADTGGPLSHAAIVAREYEIPAVLGTKIGTTSLKDGEIVVVDGTSGKVMRK